MQKRLFEIHDFILRNDDTIIVQILDNNHVDNSILIPVNKFKEYLERHDKLYFETNDMSTGQLLTRAYTLTFDNYWDEMEREYKEEDLYHYICVTYIDLTKAIDKQLENINNILNHYIW